MGGQAEGEATVPGSTDQVILAFLLGINIRLPRLYLCDPPRVLGAGPVSV